MSRLLLFISERIQGGSTLIRGWSLITGRRGYETGGGHVKFYPYEKGGWAEKVVAMLKGGGHKKFLG